MESSKVYELIYPELEDDRVCSDIKDSACKEAPHNYFWNLTSGMASKLAEQLASPSIVLTWILAGLGAPYVAIGLLQPAKEVGSMFPQLIIAGKIRAYKVRKFIWSSAAAFQGLCLLIIFGLTITALDRLSWPLILVTFFLFSIASGVASVAFSDVLGKTIPKGARGSLLGMRGMLGGVLGLMAAVFIHFQLTRESPIEHYAYLILIAAVLWFISSFCFSQIDEDKGETQGGKSALSQLKSGLKLLKQDRGFLIFLISRTYLLSITLSIPFYTLHARKLSESSLLQMGGLIFALSLSQILSSPFWGKFSDIAANKVMFISGLMALISGAIAITIERAASAGLIESKLMAGIYLVVFFGLGMAQAGARIGRKTYLVDYAPTKERPLYVAMANTWMGIMTIAGAGLGFISDSFGLTETLYLILALNLLGLLSSMRMPEIK